MSRTWIEPVGDSTTKQWTGGIDWVTSITRDEKRSGFQEEFAREVHKAYGSATEDPKPFKLARYQGWRTSAVRVGRSGASCLLQVSGRVSDEVWTPLAWCGGEVTRLDVQVSLLLPVSLPLWYKRFLMLSTRNQTPLRSSSPLLNFQK